MNMIDRGAACTSPRMLQAPSMTGSFNRLTKGLPFKHNCQQHVFTCFDEAVTRHEQSSVVLAWFDIGD